MLFLDTLVQDHLLERAKISANTANKDLIYLRALFNYGNKKNLVDCNPTSNLDFFPVEKRKKYVPPKSDVFKVIDSADPDTQDYLWSILCTAARVGEINGLTWDDVDFDSRLVTLWTRKKKGGNREPRDVPMVSKLYDILKYRFETREPQLQWVFWHSYWSRKDGRMKIGPYGDRKKIMTSLCKKAGVRYFRFHPLRHLTASILDDQGVPIGVIQRILGHEVRRTTERYLHSVGEAERKAMSKLDDIDLFDGSNKKDRIKKPAHKHKEFWLRKVERPDFKTLEKDVQELGYTGAGRKYGVSDNAVRKWVRFYQHRTESAI
jgi:integrase